MSKIDDTTYPRCNKISQNKSYILYVSLRSVQHKICPTYREGFTNPRPDFEQFMKEFDTHFGAKWDPFGAGQIIESIESFLHLMLPGSSLAWPDLFGSRHSAMSSQRWSYNRCSNQIQEVNDVRNAVFDAWIDDNI